MAKQRLLDRIKAQLAEQGLPARSQAARAWLQKELTSKTLNIGARMAFVNASARSMQHFDTTHFIGRIFFFFYDAKLKKELPYWDKFPLVIPIEIYNDSFLGLNLHYLHPSYRAILLDKLESIVNNKKYDDTTKMRISYSYLKKTTKILPKEAKPCIKKYLYTHIQSRFLPISGDEWEIVIFLPWEDFTSSTRSGITKQQVWQDSQAQF
jgi:hypothetical protein